ncbi:MAG TPA: hypothetical protein VFT22_23115 [Kofleriaceae bacterium]|nr:hypothetical protein [Kofleriaceae bacterium]
MVSKLYNPRPAAVAALVIYALASAAGCGSSTSLAADECARQCTDLAGSDSGFCPKVCAATCYDRCSDLARRTGGLPCDTFCSSTCGELQHQFGIQRELCGWIVENRPSPTYTPRSLEPAP